ncbi:hypothetical protein BDF20DRAFT_917931 [Mycotypha africana]|uniref:uncharacterized protein n=1 Tax=Mycotypha africana TaxID=64632 RepID=UPI00230137CB|nr:uncharacterized protein BDF20DRAFT_917931 [Mycotypha africana]KAI8967122.1 hypothetical protein BDF20DRAFT_917931 [Mycotypha africana]
MKDRYYVMFKYAHTIYRNGHPSRVETCWYIAKVLVFFKYLIEPNRESHFVLGEVYDGCISSNFNVPKAKPITDINKKYVVFETTDILCPVGLISTFNILPSNKVDVEAYKSVIYPGDVIDPVLLKNAGDFRNLFTL